MTDQASSTTGAQITPQKGNHQRRDGWFKWVSNRVLAAVLMTSSLLGFNGLASQVKPISKEGGPLDFTDNQTAVLIVLIVCWTILVLASLFSLLPSKSEDDWD